MKNYSRYNGYSEAKYNKKGLSYYLMRQPADKVIFPYIRQILNKNVLEVGVGYGYYTKELLKNNNKVTGADVNPHLYTGEIYKADIKLVESADRLAENVMGEYDWVLSFFMTEYLCKNELHAFISQSIHLIGEEGIFASTIILNKGIGKLYTTLARVKGITKYCYSYQEIAEMSKMNGYQVKLTPLYSIMKIPFAIFLQIERETSEKSEDYIYH